MKNAPRLGERGPLAQVRALALLPAALMAVLLAGCGREHHPAPSSALLQAGEVDLHLAPYTYVLMKDQWTACRKLRRPLRDALESADPIEVGPLTREGKIRRFQRGEGRPELASIAVLQDQIARRVIYLEIGRHPLAETLRRSFDEIQAYCSDLTRPGSVAAFEPSGEAGEVRNREREARIEGRLAAIFDSQPFLMGPDPTGARRIRSMAERAGRQAYDEVVREKGTPPPLLPAAIADLERPAGPSRRRASDDVPWVRPDLRLGAASLRSGAPRVYFDWRWYVRQERLRIEARIENVGTAPIQGGMAKVVVFRYSDRVLAKQNVAFEARQLLPGGETFFSMVLPPVSYLDHVEFTLLDGEGMPIATSKPIESRKNPQPPESAGN